MLNTAALVMAEAAYEGFGYDLNDPRIKTDDDAEELPTVRITKLTAGGWRCGPAATLYRGLDIVRVSGLSGPRFCKPVPPTVALELTRSGSMALHSGGSTQIVRRASAPRMSAYPSAKAPTMLPRTASASTVPSSSPFSKSAPLWAIVFVT